MISPLFQEISQWVKPHGTLYYAFLVFLLNINFNLFSVNILFSNLFFTLRLFIFLYNY